MRFVTALILVLLCCSVVSVHADHPPNLIIICVDDLGYGDLHSFGTNRFRTPNLDRMMSEGMKLTSFYTAPVCSATRAQLMTGCYHARVSIPDVLHPGDGTGLNPAEITIAERLQSRGYATACFGKWHLGDQEAFLPCRQGFERSFGLPYSSDMQLRPAVGGRAVVPLLENDRVTELLTESQQSALTERYTQRALDFITDHPDKPFFLYLAHSAVHVPLHPGPRFAGRSGISPFADCLEEIDASTGRILQTLRERPAGQNTLVLFVSDNGPWLSKAPDCGSPGKLRGGKGTTWEGGMRVPAIAWWPGRIAPGSASDAICGMIDILPTALDLPGGPRSETTVMDGRSLLPLLSGATAQSGRLVQYYFSGYSLQAVRRGDWKLAVRSQPDAFGNGVAPDAAINPRLYHLARDPSESISVAAANPAIVADLSRLAEEMNAEIGGLSPQARRPPGVVSTPKTLFPVATVPRPVLTGPPVQNSLSRPLITWRPIPEILTWDLWISGKQESAAIVRGRSATSAFVPSKDLEPGEYRVWVQGTYTDGIQTPWSYAHNFAVVTVPVVNAPVGVSSSPSPIVSWTAVTEASTYDVWINSLPQGRSPAFRNPSVTGLRIPVTPGLPLGNYVVWVRARTSTGFLSSWSTGRQFTIASPPTLISPVNRVVGNRPEFTWTAVPGATSYDLWVRNLTSGQDNIIRERSLVQSGFQPATALPAGKYQWWVQASSASGLRSTWSTGGQFAIQ